MSFRVPVRAVPSHDEAAMALIVKVGQALHGYGAPAHQLEASLTMLADKLGLEGRFYSTPTAILAGFGPAHEGRTSLVRVDPGETNLGKMAQLSELMGAIARGDIEPRKGCEHVEAIAAAKVPYPGWLSAICCGLAASAAAVFFGAREREIALALGIGVVVGMTLILANQFPVVARLHGVVAGALAALIASLSTAWLGPIAIFPTALAGIVILLPGLSFTTAMTELATRNLASGTARFAGACVQLLGLGLGLGLGGRAAAQSGPPLPPLDWPLGMRLAAVLIGALAASILLRARVRDFAAIIVASSLAYLGARLGGVWFGAVLGAFLGALVLELTSIGYARIFDKPVAVTLLPGLIVLVPGSIGMQSVHALLENDVVAGVQAAFTMLLIAMALAGGLIVAQCGAAGEGGPLVIGGGGFASIPAQRKSYWHWQSATLHELSSSDDPSQTPK